MNDRELFHAMDACRPGSDDMDLPEMQALKARLASDPKWQQTWQHLQRLDGEFRRSTTGCATSERSPPAGRGSTLPADTAYATMASEEKQVEECEPSPPWAVSVGRS